MFVSMAEFVMEENKAHSLKVGDTACVVGKDDNLDMIVTEVHVVKVGTSYVYVSLNNAILAFERHSGFLKGMSCGPFLCSNRDDNVRKVRAIDTIQNYLSQYNAFSKMSVEALESIAYIMSGVPLDPRIGDKPYRPRYRENNAST